MEFIQRLYSDLSTDEGKRSKVYNDSMGIPTVGIGCNLRDNGLCEAAIYAQFLHDVATAEAEVAKVVPKYNSLSDNRRAALINMAFNLGHRLGGFQKFLAAVNAGNWHTASHEMIDSTWAKQVGERAVRLSNLIIGG